MRHEPLVLDPAQMGPVELHTKRGEPFSDAASDSV